MRLFSLILFIAFSSLNSFSQSIPMLGQNIVWTERSVSVTDIIEYWPYEIWTDGDTLIDNTLYYKLYRGDFEESNITSEAYIREDSGKTYVRISEVVTNWCAYGSFDTFPIDEDVLLFDSSVDEGDTLRVWTFYDLPDTLNRLLIENIDTLFISGMDRRVLSFYSLDNFVNGQWIEGISMIRGLFGPWCEDDEAYNELLCYSVNYATIYPEGANCIVGIEEYTMNNQISIFPNPSNRYITIQNKKRY